MTSSSQSHEFPTKQISAASHGFACAVSLSFSLRCFLSSGTCSRALRRISLVFKFLFFSRCAVIFDFISISLLNSIIVREHAMFGLSSFFFFEKKFLKILFIYFQERGRREKE